MALSFSSSSSDGGGGNGGGDEEESALEAWASGNEHLRLDMLTNETTHRRMVEVGGSFGFGRVGFWCVGRWKDLMSGVGRRMVGALF